MRAERLEIALASGALMLPKAGDIAVYRPRIGDDLSALPRARVVVISGFKPDHDHFAAQGYRVAGGPPFAAAIICLPRAKAQARAMIARASREVKPGGPLVIDGQKTDGVDAVLKECRAHFEFLSDVLAKAHGKIAVLAARGELSGWSAAMRAVPGGFCTLPGVFSADGPDRGSVLLAAALPDTMPARVGDLGAGWGYLARAILARAGVQHLDLVEAEADALTCARLNLDDPRAAFHWADATVFTPERPWGAVVMNPPFHAGRAADPGLGIAFLAAAHRGLAANGMLWLVANRQLPYAQALAPMFRTVQDIGGDASFRLIRAAGPVRAR